MKEVLSFLITNKVFYLATAGGDHPHVRPLGFVMDYNGKLAFSTSNQKDMYKQLVANPHVEICCVDAEFNTLRVRGKAVFCTTEETQRKALEVMPSLGNLYAVGDGKFEIFSLDNVQAVYQTISGEKRSLTV
ncbi:MAG TPA: pyridoxamine 5'-phosphate oxidase family protein [Methylomusa anaerophila]|uniref:Pyridoxamine 5'-phosphate oxidase n=1 Tax=Methylomusa anaerophila TaxID=1930071 RepID=A0A348AIK7_9FIRM|nr:pyridoxamine 5'-phosphate oxidase family protein [Methylomusa anaerophila]BBB90905.1 pyridoxamine 5'-phosphate oxidase [Methylomusa anaerophila]HML90689.1 pyridoxamine 5'-phosphate oxidase family protein [Methylomusa anaerophila]